MHEPGNIEPPSPEHGDRDTLAGAKLTIDLDALAANWKSLDQRSGAAECGAAVKGNGYGIGLEQAVGALTAAGCRTFFVALPDEGIRARQVSDGARIFVLNGLMKGAGDELLRHNLLPVLGSVEETVEWRELAGRHGRPLPAALHVDTGMNRLGMSESEARSLVSDSDNFKGVNLQLIVSHLACGSTPDHSLNVCQQSVFRNIRDIFPAIHGSLANSAGIFLGSGYHHDLVRPGISLYGGAALDDHLRSNPMRPVVKVEARILQIRTVPTGEGIGYGSAECAKRDSKVAIVGAGYADGYHRRAGSSDTERGAFGYFRQQKVPVIGRVSMDLTAFDITDCLETRPERGDWITMLGGDAALGAVAACAQTIDYELLTGLGSRYSRHYISAAS